MCLVVQVREERDAMREQIELLKGEKKELEDTNR